MVHDAALGSSSTSFSPLARSLISPLPLSSASTDSTSNNAMVSTAFNAIPQPIRPPATSASSFPTPVEGSPAMNGFERDRDRGSASASAVGTPFNAAAGAVASPSSIRIRRLPLNTTEETIRLMTVFSKDLTDVQMLSPELSEDAGYRAAVLSFDSLEGALEAKNMLDGKKNIANDATLIVEMVHSGGRRFTADMSAAVTPGSSVASSRGSSRFPFQSFELGATYSTAAASAVAATRPTSDLANSEPVTATQMQSIFSTQSPIGTHRNEIALHTGKDLINHDTTSDDETRELLKDPVAYAESNGNGAAAAVTATAVSAASAASAAASTVGTMGNPSMYPMPPQLRRSTTSQLSFNQHMAALSLNTAATATPGPMSAYNQVTSPYSAHPGALPPAAMGGPPHQQPGGYHGPYRNHNLPPANPADQNPPCNTLYVGNIPMDTSEEELKALFSKQRGYKRLSVRTKGNGPMCFVEFEDISFATKTLYELYGAMLRGSTRGGIRLSFSKNPLGVRSGQHPVQNAGNAAAASMNAIGGLGGNGFAAASGPPPGLAAPPGLSVARMPYNATASLMNGSTVLPTSGTNMFSSTSPPPGYGGAGLTSNAWSTGTPFYYNQLGSAGTNANASSAMGGTAAGYPPFMMGK